MEESVKDEVWSDRLFAIALDVADVLRRSGATGEAVTEAIDFALEKMSAGEFERYLLISTPVAQGTDDRITATFLFDQFRSDLTAATKERLFSLTAH